MRRDSTTKQAPRKLLLRACPRCQGDLFPDEYDEELACLQCGRRVSSTMLVEQPKEAALAA